VTVVVAALLAAGAGGFLLSRMDFRGADNRPAGAQARAAAKGQEAEARQSARKAKAAGERAAPKSQGKRPAPPAATPPAPEKSAGRPAAGEPPAPPPIDENNLVLDELDKQLEHYHQMIKPGPGEWKFAEVPWETTVWQARKKAAQEGKPMFIWYMAGEPLGQC
jgi:hypothetical protein